MFKSNLKKIKEINKEIEKSSTEHHHKRYLAQKRYERVSKNIDKKSSSEFKKKIKDEMSSY
ncbi:hypothetical protein [Salinicoccus roseus]|uniref:Uncharacterized protein n=1 Tax=Salinicoccus roseus TaxID=45670 RepID=A0A265E934_9STAP|nr:hypothetical protein [Salinicoccus roseus]OZT77778.1 hypothetical protein CFN03_00360 [Salinicoccus roseus]